MASLRPDGGKWRVIWRTSPKKQKSKTFERKRDASAFKAKVEHELAQGTYLDHRSIAWTEFRRRYFEDVVSLLKPGTQGTYKTHLDNFDRIANPDIVADIDSAMIDRFKAKRKQERGEKVGSRTSAATVNNELRSLRAALNKAKSWKFIKDVPEIVFLKEVEKLPRVMSEEHFVAIYKACSMASYPQNLPYPAAQWWRGLVTFLYCTGWRISEPLRVLRKDIDLEHGVAVTRENKGSREEVVQLAEPVVRELTPMMKSFGVEMFPWPHGDRLLYEEWHRIQDAAGIELDCSDDQTHECNSECRHYGFHDLRRTFATRTGAELSRDELKTVMRHKATQTTDSYINLRERLVGVDMRSKLNLPAGLENPELLTDDSEAVRATLSDSGVAHTWRRKRKAK